MVRISEIIRKSVREKEKEEAVLVPPPLKLDRKEKVEREVERGVESEVRKSYEVAILYAKRLMNDIMQEKTLENGKLLYIAEKIVDGIHNERDLLLSLVNDFSLDIKKDNYLYEHSVNTSILATNLGSALGYNRPELVDLCASSLLHDIGMMKIPEEIRNKPSKLTKEEFNLIKKHPLFGLELLEKIKNPPKSAYEVIYQHHEKIDGSGYPEEKKGDEISKYAKIVGLVEAYEARTHPRPYHRVLPYEGVKIVVQAARISFDQELVKAFLKYITPYPPGSFVLLNNSEIGRVVHINEDLPMCPVVDIILDAENNFLEKPKRINLADTPVLSIKKALNEPAM